MADKPQKCVVIYGDGFLLDNERKDGQETASTTLEDAGLEHLHLAAKDGCSGFLAVREFAPGDGEVGRSLADLAQLLDVHDLYTAAMQKEDCSGSTGGAPLPSLAERFKGIPAALLSNSPPATSLGKRVGMTLLPFDAPGGALPDASETADRVLRLLQLPDASSAADVAIPPAAGAPAGAAGGYDLVLIHVHAHALAPENSDASQRSSAIVRGLQWLDVLIGRLRALSPPGSAAACHLYLTTLLSYPVSAFANPPQRELLTAPPKTATNPSNGDSGLPGWDALRPNSAPPPGLPNLRPKQSYRTKAGQDLPSVRWWEGGLSTKRFQ